MLLTIMVGIFVVGMVMQNYQQLTYVENQGLVTLQQIVNVPTAAADPCNAVATAVLGAAGNLKTSGTNGIQISLSFSGPAGSYSNPSSGTTSPTGFTCTDGSAYMQSGESVTFTVTYPSKVLGFNPTPNGLMTLTSTEQI
jgi:hypothetical protein